MMKRFTAILLLLAVLCSLGCKKKNDYLNLPQINFSEARYILGKGEVTIQLEADTQMEQRVEVPYSFYGKAIEGEHFTASAKSFVFEPGSETATVTLTRIEETMSDDTVELTMNLEKAPTGFRLGVMNFTSVELFGKNSVFISFSKEKDQLTEQGSYEIFLEKMDGSNYRVPEKTQFNVDIAPSSTAIEGIHFQFKDNERFATVRKNRNKGFLSLQFLKKEEGKDRLVLRLADKEGYAFGSNRELTIRILGPYDISGTWALDTIANLEWFKGPAWGGMIDVTAFPTISPKDQITITGSPTEGYQLTPQLTGDFRHFFIQPTSGKYLGEVEKDFQELASGGRYLANVAWVEFAEVNRHFSENKSKIAPARLGFRILEIDGEEILECTLDDFEPTAFLKDAYEMMGSLEWTPLRLHFKRAK